jgi:hypothetical protein
MEEMRLPRRRWPCWRRRRRRLWSSWAPARHKRENRKGREMAGRLGSRRLRRASWLREQATARVRGVSLCNTERDLTWDKRRIRGCLKICYFCPSFVPCYKIRKRAFLFNIDSRSVLHMVIPVALALWHTAKVSFFGSHHIFTSRFLLLHNKITMSISI